MAAREFPPVGAQVVLDGRTYTYERVNSVEGWWSADRLEYARPFDTAGQGLHVLWEHDGRQMKSNGPDDSGETVTVMATDPGSDA